MSQEGNALLDRKDADLCYLWILAELDKALGGRRRVKDARVQALFGSNEKALLVDLGVHHFVHDIDLVRVDRASDLGLVDKRTLGSLLRKFIDLFCPLISAAEIFKRNLVTTKQ